jgi:hypothetical protein
LIFKNKDTLHFTTKLCNAALEDLANTLGKVSLAPEDMPTSLEGKPEDVTATVANADDNAGFLEGMAGKPEDVAATAAHADDVADSSGDRKPEDVTATTAHAYENVGFLEGMEGKPEDVTATAALADDVADSSGDRQAGISLPLFALPAGANDELQPRRRISRGSRLRRRRRGSRCEQTQQTQQIISYLQKPPSMPAMRQCTKLNQLASISSQVLMMFGKNKGGPWFDRTFKRDWRSYEKSHQ